VRKRGDRVLGGMPPKHRPDDGNGARHSLISPSDATLYLTTRGRSFSKYISTHLMKYPMFFIKPTGFCSLPIP